MIANGYIPYLTRGLMSGRPTRTIVQFLCHRAYACDKEKHVRKPDTCIEEHDRKKEYKS